MDQDDSSSAQGREHVCRHVYPQGDACEGLKVTNLPTDARDTVGRLVHHYCL
eukprot:CAMPEP_0185558630 /NCGR_PEP_ID=MMETSP1381-20130426/52674_1 /TAXON_ID=298111 /ORGANISM="Pavlova sp., Strain CCMP459" /LENGTH=51 /DNA_ID=CAMNT_0028172191 /DNA_START=136 /DNA_END=291 /DNA_ORIENTATION=+